MRGRADRARPAVRRKEAMAGAKLGERLLGVQGNMTEGVAATRSSNAGDESQLQAHNCSSTGLTKTIAPKYEKGHAIDLQGTK